MLDLVKPPVGGSVLPESGENTAAGAAAENRIARYFVKPVREDLTSRKTQAAQLHDELFAIEAVSREILQLSPLGLRDHRNTAEMTIIEAATQLGQKARMAERGYYSLPDMHDAACEARTLLETVQGHCGLSEHGHQLIDALEKFGSKYAQAPLEKQAELTPA